MFGLFKKELKIKHSRNCAECWPIDLCTIAANAMCYA